MFSNIQKMLIMAYAPLIALSNAEGGGGGSIFIYLFTLRKCTSLPLWLLNKTTNKYKIQDIACAVSLFDMPKSRVSNDCDGLIGTPNFEAWPPAGKMATKIVSLSMYLPSDSQSHLALPLRGNSGPSARQVGPIIATFTTDGRTLELPTSSCLTELCCLRATCQLLPG